MDDFRLCRNNWRSINILSNPFWGKSLVHLSGFFIRVTSEKFR
jgi:hypothetical protein